MTYKKTSIFKGITTELLNQVFEKSSTWEDAFKHLNVSYSPTHRKKLVDKALSLGFSYEFLANLPYCSIKKSLLAETPPEKLLLLCKESDSLSEVSKKLGIPTGGNYYRLLKNLVMKAGFDVTSFPKQKIPQNFCSKVEDSLFFTKGSLKSGASIKRRLLKLGVPEICSCCGLGNSWKGLPLALQVDHIDGDPSNNLLENLRFICPNCHTQTPTYSGRNQKRVYTEETSHSFQTTPKAPRIVVCEMEGCDNRLSSSRARYCPTCKAISQRYITRPTKQELSHMMESLSFTRIGKQLGVSGNTVSKWWKAYNR